MPPLVSVIIPTYNRRRLLVGALRSVLRQAVDELEILVVDDGSEEDIGAAIGEAGAPARHIRIARSGVAIARNTGIEAARGEYVALLDSDDEWLPGHLAGTVPILRERPEVGLVYHACRSVDEAGRDCPPRRARACPSGRVTPALFAYDFVPTSSVVCRRSLLVQAGGFDRRFVPSEDYDLWLRLSRLCCFAAADGALTLRRVHAGGISRQHKTRNELIRAVLKERFYRDPCSRGLLTDADARAVLAKAFYRSGRLLLQGGHPRSARRFLRRALRYRPAHVPAIGLLAATWWPRLGRGSGAADPSEEVLGTTQYALDAT